jgi:hypothetical protein
VSAVEFTIKRTKADYIGAVFMHVRKSPAALAPLLMSPLIVGILPLFLSDDAPLPARLLTSLLFFGLTFVVLIVALIPCYYWVARNGWRSPGAFEPISYAFDDASVRIQSASGSGEVVWAVFNGAFEDAKLFLLRQHPGLLQIIPKRGLPADVLPRLRQLVRAHVVGPLKIES